LAIVWIVAPNLILLSPEMIFRISSFFIMVKICFLNFLQGNNFC
jgi:hypothetical protein